MSKIYKKALITAISLALIIVAAYFVFGKIANIQYYEPCSDVVNIPIISEVGPYWIKLAGNDDRIWLGEAVETANMPGSSKIVKLASLNRNQVSLIIVHNGRRLGSDTYKIEKYRRQCQSTFLSNDPMYLKKNPERLLTPDDFNQEWQISDYNQFVSTQIYSHVGEPSGGYNSWIRAQTKTNSYMIWASYIEYSSTELAEMEYLASQDVLYNLLINYPNLVYANANNFISCDKTTTICVYTIQAEESLLEIRIRYLYSDNGTESIPTEDLEYLFDLASKKFLQAISE